MKFAGLGLVSGCRSGTLSCTADLLEIHRPLFQFLAMPEHRLSLREDILETEGRDECARCIYD